MNPNFTLAELEAGIQELLTDDADLLLSVSNNVKKSLADRELQESIDLFWALEYEVFRRFATGRGQTYEQFYTDRSISYWLLADIICRYTESGDSVVEVGCGSGKCLTYLADRGLRSTGIDRSTIALEYLANLARTYGVDVNTINRDFLRIPQLREFDFAFNVGVLEHFDEKRQREVIQNMLMMSRNGILIAIPNRNSPVRRTIIEHYTAKLGDLEYPDKHYHVDLEAISNVKEAEVVERGGFNILPSKLNQRFLDDDGEAFYTKRLPRVKFKGDVQTYIHDWTRVEQSLDPADRLKFGWYNYTVLRKNGS